MSKSYRNGFCREVAQPGRALELANDRLADGEAVEVYPW